MRSWSRNCRRTRRRPLFWHTRFLCRQYYGSDWLDGRLVIVLDVVIAVLYWLERGQIIFELGRSGDWQHIVVFCVWNRRPVFFLQATTTPEVESVYASAQVRTIGFHTAESEHAHSRFSSASTYTGKMPDIAARSYNIKFKFFEKGSTTRV